MGRTESALDKNLEWGECVLTPDEVTRQVTLKPWDSEPKVQYGTERLTVEGEDAESIYDINHAPIPTRGMIVRILLSHADAPKPWKSRVRSKFDSGWLVVSETGWKFYPNLNERKSK